MHKLEYIGGMCVCSDVLTYCQKPLLFSFVLILTVLLLHLPMQCILCGFKCRVFHTFLQAAPGALILMVKTASLSTELLTITILGKVSLVASGSSSARPVGHSRTEAEAICVFLLLCPVQGGCLGKL